VRAHLAFLIETQLLAQEEVLSCECGLGLKEAAQEPKKIHGEVTNVEGRVRKTFA
jgi:hypothetical protein